MKVGHRIMNVNSALGGLRAEGNFDPLNTVHWYLDLKRRVIPENRPRHFCGGLADKQNKD